jgi:hypothetical protein
MNGKPVKPTVLSGKPALCVAPTPMSNAQFPLYYTIGSEHPAAPAQVLVVLFSNLLAGSGRVGEGPGPSPATQLCADAIAPRHGETS